MKINIENKKFYLTNEEFERFVEEQAYSSARNLLDRSKDNTKNGQREKYKNVKCKLGSTVREVQKALLTGDTGNQFRKCVMIYLVHDMNPAYRPEVHRINSNGDYEIENIKIMNKIDHVKETTSKMQGVLIMRDKGKSYQVIGLDIVKSKKDLAEKIGVPENVIYKAKRGQVIQINDTIYHFQDVIQEPAQELKRDEVLGKMEYFTFLMERYKDNPAEYERFARMYRIYRNMAIKKGFIEK